MIRSNPLSYSRPGTYLLRQNCDKYDQFFLHYLPPSDSPPENSSTASSPSSTLAPVRPEVLHVTRVHNPTRYVLTGGAAAATTVPYGTQYDSLLDLARALSTSKPSSEDGRSVTQAAPLLSSCLHPSENDKANTLLLCRSDSKQRSG